MNRTRLENRLGTALAAYSAGIILVVTLVPFRFAVPTRLVTTGFVSGADVVANVALFLPLGFFLAFGGERRPLVVGLLFSAAIELLQEFLPGRFPSPLDVVTNAAGAWLGGFGYRLARAGLTRRASPVGLLALDLPLAGLVYLLVPLLWLTGLAAGGDGGQRGVAALIGWSGATAFAAIDRHLLAPRGTPRMVMPAAAGLWFGLGLLPGWFHSPGWIAGGVVAIAGLTGALSALLASAEPAGRRYELPAVRRAGAALAGFIAISALWPPAALEASWRGGLGLGWGHDAGQVAILRFLQLLAAFTVAGYAVAEARGRAIESPARSRRVIWLAGWIGGLVIVGLRGFHPAYRASGLELVLLAGATRFGAAVYWRQRALVQALLRARAGPEPTGQREPLGAP